MVCSHATELRALGGLTSLYFRTQTGPLHATIPYMLTASSMPHGSNRHALPAAWRVLL